MINQAPEIVSQSKIEETDYNTLKITLLGVIAVAVSIFTVYEFNQFLLTFQYAFLWFSLFGMLALLILNIFLVFFVKHFAITFGVVFAEAFFPLIFFFSYFKGPHIEVLLGGFFLFFIFLLLGIGRGVSRFRNSIKMRFFEITKVVTPKLVTGFLILASVLFYAQYFLWGSINETMARGIFDESLRSSEPIVHLWYSDISTDQTVGEFFSALTTSQIKKNPEVTINGVPVNIRDGLKELPLEMQVKIMGTLSSELQKKVEDKVGPLNQNATVSDELYRFLNEWLDTLTPNIRTMLGIMATVLLFLVVKGFAFLVYWIINLLAFLIFKLLVVANFAVPGYETRTREFVILP